MTGTLPERLTGYRTVIFSLVMGLGMLVTLLTGVDRTEEANQLAQGVDGLLTGLAIVWTIGSLWLRAITETPIFNKW